MSYELQLAHKKILSFEEVYRLVGCAESRRGSGLTRLRVDSAFHALDLCETAIHKQFHSRDVAAVVGCQKHHGFGDLI